MDYCCHLINDITFGLTQSDHIKWLLLYSSLFCSKIPHHWQPPVLPNLPIRYLHQSHCNPEMGSLPHEWPEDCQRRSCASPHRRAERVQTRFRRKSKLPKEKTRVNFVLTRCLRGLTCFCFPLIGYLINSG